MAEAKKKEAKKEVKSTRVKITKSNGRVIYREKELVGGAKSKRMKAKGWKVEEV